MASLMTYLFCIVLAIVLGNIDAKTISTKPPSSDNATTTSNSNALKIEIDLQDNGTTVDVNASTIRTDLEDESTTEKDSEITSKITSTTLLNDSENGLTIKLDLQEQSTNVYESTSTIKPDLMSTTEIIKLDLPVNNTNAKNEIIKLDLLENTTNDNDSTTLKNGINNPTVIKLDLIENSTDNNDTTDPTIKLDLRENNTILSNNVLINFEGTTTDNSSKEESSSESFEATKLDLQENTADTSTTESSETVKIDLTKSTAETSTTDNSEAIKIDLLESTTETSTISSSENVKLGLLENTAETGTTESSETIIKLDLKESTTDNLSKELSSSESSETINIDLQKNTAYAAAETSTTESSERIKVDLLKNTTETSTMSTTEQKQVDNATTVEASTITVSSTHSIKSTFTTIAPDLWNNASTVIVKLDLLENEDVNSSTIKLDDSTTTPTKTLGRAINGLTSENILKSRSMFKASKNRKSLNETTLIVPTTSSKVVLRLPFPTTEKKVPSLPVVNTYENPCKKVEGSSCLNGGKCIQIDNLSFECDCSEDFTGQFCEFINACKENPCRNGGKCESFEDSGVCSCLWGYTGTFCELRKPGSVQSIYDDFDAEFTNSLDESSNRKFEKKTKKYVSDPCATSPWGIEIEKPCLNNGTCISLSDNSYECDCSEDFTGKYCQFVNACKNSPCKNEGTCESYEDSGICNCPVGFIGTYCSEIDDFRLITIDEDKSSTSQASLQSGRVMFNNNSDNINSSSSSKLLFNPCGKIDPKPCKNNGRCINVDEKSFECECSSEFEFTGALCQFKNPCFDQPCQNGGTCEAFDDSGVCTCTFSYTGTFCEHEIIIETTTERPIIVQESKMIGIKSTDGPCNEPEKRCLNGGTCIPHRSTIECDCPENFIGKYCEFDNACFKSPCKNGGTCESFEDSGVCSCPHGFKGTYCEEIDDSPQKVNNNRQNSDSFSLNSRRLIMVADIDHCDNSEDDKGKPSCLNGGKCVILDEDLYGCECPLGFTGAYCDFVDACASAPCINGGTCESYEDSGICICQIGFSGMYCENGSNDNDANDNVDELSSETEIPPEILLPKRRDSVVEHIYRSKIPNKQPYPLFLQLKTKGYFAKDDEDDKTSSLDKERVLSIPGFEDIDKNMIRVAKDGTIYIRKPKRISKSDNDDDREKEISNDQEQISSANKPRRILDANIVKVMPNGELFIKVKLPIPKAQ